MYMHVLLCGKEWITLLSEYLQSSHVLLSVNMDSKVSEEMQLKTEFGMVLRALVNKCGLKCLLRVSTSLLVFSSLQSLRYEVT